MAHGLSKIWHDCEVHPQVEGIRGTFQYNNIAKDFDLGLGETCQLSIHSMIAMAVKLATKGKKKHQRDLPRYDTGHNPNTLT